MSYEITTETNVSLDLRCNECSSKLDVDESMSNNTNISIDYCSCVDIRIENEKKENSDMVCEKIIDIVSNSQAPENVKLDILNKIDIGRLTDWD